MGKVFFPILGGFLLISLKAKKNLVFFPVKDLFFSIGKKGRGLTAPPLFSRKMLRRGGGQLGGFVVMIILQKFLKINCFGIWKKKVAYLPTFLKTNNI